MNIGVHAHERTPESDYPPVDLWIDIDTLPDPYHDPVRIDWVGSSGVRITGHTGLYAVDICPYVIVDLPDPHLRAWLDAYSLHHLALAHVRRDWRTILRPWLQMPVCRASIPHQVRWRP